jgi:hypothetical protein
MALIKQFLIRNIKKYQTQDTFGAQKNLPIANYQSGFIKSALRKKSKKICFQTFKEKSPLKKLNLKNFQTITTSLLITKSKRISWF